MLAALNYNNSYEAETKRTHLEALRAQVGALDGSLRTETYAHVDVAVGIPKGAVIELLGPARYEFVAHFLAQQNRPCLWVQKELSFFPTALLQRGIDLQKNVFVEAGVDVQWVLKQALQAQVFPFIVGEDFAINEKELRKLQLLAERSGASFLHICSDYRPSWVPMLSLNIEQQMNAQGELSFRSQILRKRGSL